MFQLRKYLWLLICLLPIIGHAQERAHETILRQVTPTAGHLLHGTFPGSKTGEEDDLTPRDVDIYENTVGRRVSWVYFSNNWYRDRAFPVKTAKWIRARGATPYVRLALRSSPEQDRREPLFTVAAIARGDFDADIAAWARGAARFKTPIIAEYGTEMNGEWFPWNGKWSGRKKGAALFVLAYRRIIDLSRAAGAHNLIWVFHANNWDEPDRRWNRMENYYPGDRYIDWLAVSIYSAQNPFTDENYPFTKSLALTMDRFAQMAPDKPVVIAEFGTDVRNPREPAAPWADKALTTILSGKYPQLIGFSWWNETWPNGDDPARATDLRVQSNPALTAIFRRHMRNKRIIRIR